MILVGIGIGAFLGAATTWVTLQFPIEQIRPAIVWTMGSVYGSTWSDVRLLGFSLLGAWRRWQSCSCGTCGCSSLATTSGAGWACTSN